MIPVCVASQTAASQSCFPEARINRDQAAIAGSDVNLTLPNRDPAVGARGIGTVDGLVQTNLGIKLPKQFSGRGINCVDDRQWRAHICHAIYDDRFRDNAHSAVDVQKPRQSQVADILIGDLFQRTEMLLVESAAVERPIISFGRFGSYPGFVHIAGFRWAVLRGPSRNRYCESQTQSRETKNSPCLHIAHL